MRPKGDTVLLLMEMDFFQGKLREKGTSDGAENIV